MLKGDGNENGKIINRLAKTQKGAVQFMVNFFAVIVAT